jgi:hypothetical protein
MNRVLSRCFFPASNAGSTVPLAVRRSGKPEYGMDCIAATAPGP